MATKTFSLVTVLIIAFVSTAAVSARPCKPLFYFSSTSTTTYYPTINQYSNPKPGPHYYTVIFTTTTRRFPHAQLSYYNPASSKSRAESGQDVPLKVSSHSSPVSSSITDRTKEIMSIVGALHFGVGCGALTAAIMFFLWALFSPRRSEFEDILSSSDDNDDDYDDVAETKRKLRDYVAVPMTEAVEDDVKKPVA